MTDEKKKLWKEWQFSFEQWMPTFMSAPIKLVRSKDCSESYERDSRHIFLLENGQYALVVEKGCSCYSYSDAKIELFPKLKDANKAFEKIEDYEDNKLKWK